MIEPRTLKGFRDFLPKEAQKRKFVIETLRKVFESYGFEPLETPALEYEDILTGKYGEEGDKLMYRFEDNGQRKVAMRYDQTVPLARVVAQYSNELPMPFKRYQIQNVWRAENTQKGRFREFLQCDVDIVGTSSYISDSEIIYAAISSLTTLGFKNFKVLVNDRKIFEGIDQKAITIIDKLKKIGDEGVRKELSEKGFDPTILDKIKSSQPTESLEKIINSQKNYVFFEPTLARGLDYYTGLIIEVEVEGFDAGSVGGGGRYDRLIGMFEKDNIPAVGFSFGFDRLIEAMDANKLFPNNLQTSKVLVINQEENQEKVSKVAYLLRSKNINTEIYLDFTTPLDKQFKYAEKKEIPYVVLPINATEVELRSKNSDGSLSKETLSLDSLVNKLINRPLTS